MGGGAPTLCNAPPPMENTMKRYTLPGGIVTTPLYRHQPVGIVRMVLRGKQQGWYGLFDDCGLGKTRQAIYACRCLIRLGVIDRIIVICKQSLSTGWRDEFKKCTGDMSVKVLTRMAPEARTFGSADVHILNYELLSRAAKERGCSVVNPFTARPLFLNTDGERLYKFMRRYRCAVVVDEGHKIKNSESRITQTLCALREFAAVRFLLTATPEGDTPIDLWSQGYFLDGGSLLGKSLRRYCKRYVVYEQFEIPGVGKIRKPRGYKNLGLLKQQVDKLGIRRVKEQCLDLPEKIYVSRDVYPLQKEMALLRGMRDELVREVESTRQTNINLDGPSANVGVANKLVQFMIATAAPWVVSDSVQDGGKIRELFEVLDEDSGQAVVYCLHRAVVSGVRDKLRAAGIPTIMVMSGDKSNTENVTGFVAGRYRVLVGTIGYLQEGFNLQCSNRAVYYQLPWSRLAWHQSQDRQHRIGQEKTVLIERLMHRFSLDAYQYGRLVEKEKLAEYGSDNHGVVVVNKQELMDTLRAL